MKLAITAAALLATASSASAQLFTENWDDPFEFWTIRWFYLNSTAENLYFAQGKCDPSFRGNNPCGLWISDTQGCGVGTGGPTCAVKFTNGFEKRIISIKFEIICFTKADVTIYDKDGNVLAVFPGIQNGILPPCGGMGIGVESKNGVSGFTIDSTPYGGGLIEGNTSIDNLTVEAKEEGCYADCDGSGELDIDDFICFQTNFGQGSMEADCDASGELDIDDFICFQTQYGQGCK